MAQPVPGTITEGTTLTFSHANNRAGVLVIAEMGYVDPARPTVVTFNGTALTKVGERIGAYTSEQWWWLASAGVVTADVVLNNPTSSASFGRWTAIALDNVDSFGTFVEADGNTGSPIDVAITGMTANDLALASVVIRDLDNGDMTATVSGTPLYNVTASSSGTALRCRGQSGAGTGTVTLTTTPSESVFYTALGVRIIGTGGGAAVITPGLVNASRVNTSRVNRSRVRTFSRR